MKAPIHSQKHYVQWTLSTVAATSATQEKIAEGVANQDANLPSEVTEGAVVKAIYLELWFVSSSSNGSQVLIVAKNPDGGSGALYAETIALHTWKNKKNILHTHQGLSNRDSQNPGLAFRGWIKIPKSKQRIGYGDTLSVTISNPSTNTLTYCGFATYKEYQ